MRSSPMIFVVVALGSLFYFAGAVAAFKHWKSDRCAVNDYSAKKNRCKRSKEFNRHDHQKHGRSHKKDQIRYQHERRDHEQEYVFR